MRHLSNPQIGHGYIHCHNIKNLLRVKQTLKSVKKVISWNILVLLLLWLVPTLQVAAKTIAVTPFGTTINSATINGTSANGTSANGTAAWLGYGLADALSLRIYQQAGLNALTVRQITSAMRGDNLTTSALLDPAIAAKLGNQLGADLILVGSFDATYITQPTSTTKAKTKKASPDEILSFQLMLIDAKTKEVVSTHALLGQESDAINLEAKIARVLAKALGAKKPTITAGAFGTTNVDAWKHVSLAKKLIAPQSLGPAAINKDYVRSLKDDTLKQAKRYAKTAIKADDQYGDGWATLGIIEALEGDYTEAWYALGRATALGSGHHPNAILGAAFVRMRQGRTEDAVNILTSAIKRHPGFLHARGYLAELHNKMGNHDKALAAYNSYLKQVPLQPWVLAQRGYTQSKLGNPIEAIADSIAAADILPHSPVILLELASRYIDSKKYIGAQDALQHALSLHPTNPTIYVRLGYLYLLQGRDDLVIPLTEKSLLSANFKNDEKTLGYAHLNLAIAYAHQGKLDNAFSHLDQAYARKTSMRAVNTDNKLIKFRADERFLRYKQHTKR